MCGHTQNAFADDIKWANLTTAAGTAIAGFVDYDWGAELCRNSNATCGWLKGKVGM